MKRKKNCKKPKKIVKKFEIFKKKKKYCNFFNEKK